MRIDNIVQHTRWTYSIQVISNALTTALIHLSKDTLLSFLSVKKSAAIRNAAALVHTIFPAAG